VYEDQGPPFVLEAGDCVLQPPGIRHRVLESAAGLEVLEVTSPAHHTTTVEHELTLPTPAQRPDRSFGGQRFVRHRASAAEWDSWWRGPGKTRDADVGSATGGVVGVRTVWPSGSGSAGRAGHDGELVLWFVAHGAATLQVTDLPDVRLRRDDAVAIPPHVEHALVDCSRDLQLVEITCPDRVQIRPW
jgi:mannose-6-phosphate isomerase-like protein (cupin superfamily)